MNQENQSNLNNLKPASPTQQAVIQFKDNRYQPLSNDRKSRAQSSTRVEQVLFQVDDKCTILSPAQQNESHCNKNLLNRSESKHMEKSNVCNVTVLKMPKASRKEKVRMDRVKPLSRQPSTSQNKSIAISECKQQNDQEIVEDDHGVWLLDNNNITISAPNHFHFPDHIEELTETKYSNHGKECLNLEELHNPIQSIPSQLVREYAHYCKEINLKGHSFRAPGHVQYFRKLKTLILDRNNLKNLAGFPVIQTLKTLWINNNDITSLEQFIDQVAVCFPSLEYLSMMGNPASPTLSAHADPQDVREYRVFIVSKLQGIKIIDSSAVTVIEREMANLDADGLEDDHEIPAAVPKHLMDKKASIPRQKYNLTPLISPIQQNIQVPGVISPIHFDRRKSPSVSYNQGFHMMYQFKEEDCQK